MPCLAYETSLLCSAEVVELFEDGNVIAKSICDQTRMPDANGSYTLLWPGRETALDANSRRRLCLLHDFTNATACEYYVTMQDYLLNPRKLAVSLRQLRSHLAMASYSRPRAADNEVVVRGHAGPILATAILSPCPDLEVEATSKRAAIELFDCYNAPVIGFDERCGRLTAAV